MNIYKWYRNGRILKETFNPEGDQYYKRFYPDNVVVYNGYRSISQKIKHTEIWYKDGVKHRDDDKPSYILYANCGVNYDKLLWYKKGVMHRDGGKPAYISFSNSQSEIKLVAMYYVHGELHRVDGPAVEYYDHNEKVIRKEYYLNSKLYRHMEEYKSACLKYWAKDTPYRTEPKGLF